MSQWSIDTKWVFGSSSAIPSTDELSLGSQMSPQACPVSHLPNGLFCTEVNADSLRPSLGSGEAVLFPIRDTASSSGP